MTLHMDARTVPPRGALLVRVPVESPGVVIDLPAVPKPHTVSISVNDEWLAGRVDARKLGELGYRMVGIHGPAAGEGGIQALLLLSGALLDKESSWATKILLKADKAYDCDLGPVQHVFAELLAKHLTT